VKRKTFYHISLSLPYIALLISGAFTYLANGFQIFESSSAPSILTGTLVFFTFSAIVWAPLYTWMVIAMLFWGRGKNVHEIRVMYLLSPVLLACATGIPALLVNGPHSGLSLLWGFLYMNKLDFIIPILFRNYDSEQAFGIGLAWVFMAALCVVIGYAFVGIVLLIEKMLTRRGLLIEEEYVGKILPGA